MQINGLMEVILSSIGDIKPEDNNEEMNEARLTNLLGLCTLVFHLILEIGKLTEYADDENKLKQKIGLAAENYLYNLKELLNESFESVGKES